MTNLRFKNFFTGKTAIFTLLTAVSLLIWIGCAQDPQSPNQELPAPEQEQSGAVLSMDNPLVMSTIKLQCPEAIAKHIWIGAILNHICELIESFLSISQSGPCCHPVAHRPSATSYSS